MVEGNKTCYDLVTHVERGVLLFESLVRMSPSLTNSLFKNTNRLGSIIIVYLCSIEHGLLQLYAGVILWQDVKSRVTRGKHPRRQHRHDH